MDILIGVVLGSLFFIWLGAAAYGLLTMLSDITRLSNDEEL